LKGFKLIIGAMGTLNNFIKLFFINFVLKLVFYLKAYYEIEIVKKYKKLKQNVLSFLLGVKREQIRNRHVRVNLDLKTLSKVCIDKKI